MLCARGRYGDVILYQRPDGLALGSIRVVAGLRELLERGRGFPLTARAAKLGDRFIAPFMPAPLKPAFPLVLLALAGLGLPASLAADSPDQVNRGLFDEGVYDQVRNSYRSSR